MIAIATKWFAIALPPLTIIYFFIQRYYIPSARELQRIESVSRSPIYSRFAEALAGVATIRAYRAESHFTAASDVLMERNAHAFVTQKLAAGWLACRLDMLGLTVLTLCGEYGSKWSGAIRISTYLYIPLRPCMRAVSPVLFSHCECRLTVCCLAHVVTHTHTHTQAPW